MMKNWVMLVGVVALLGVCAPAGAVLVSYTVGGVQATNYPGNPVPPGAPHLVDGYGYPGDAVGLTTYTATVDLPLGTSVLKISTLTWSVSYTYNGTDNDWTNDGFLPRSTYWPELQFSINAARTMSFVGGTAGSLSQTGLLRTNWDNDYLGISAGSTSTFFVPGYQIDVTPRGLTEAEVTVWDGSPPCDQPDRDMMATFVVSEAPIPEPLTLLAVGSAVAGIAGYIRRRRLA
jgi:hypothetical protein